MEAEASSQHWESEAKEAVERAVRAKAERDAARHEVSMAKLNAKVAGSTWAQVESELTRVQRALAASKDARQKGESALTGAQHALAASEEAQRKAEDEVSRLADERVSLLLELEASKDELIGVWTEASKEKKALEEAVKAGFEVIFNFGYGCCAFARNICGSESVIPDRMSDTLKPLPPEFFINPCCPPSATPGVHTVDPNVDVREAGKSPPVVEVGLGTQSDSPIRVIGEDEEPDAAGGN